MHSSTLFVSLLSASTALALPQPGPFFRRSPSTVSNIDLPASSLPPPPANLTLKYVTLGLGTQNYTCKSTPNDANSVPATNGAKATLYDASAVLSKGTDSIKDNSEKILPSLALSLWDTYNVTPDQWPSPLKLKAVGHHFFTTALAPTFELHGENAKAQIQGKKTGDVPAPADACPGVNGEGAVHWLQLSDNGSGFSAGGALAGGVVYRVETAGGAAPQSCEGYSGDVLVKYSAEYFFYGPSSDDSC